MKRPSLANLGSLKRPKHVQFVHNDDTRQASKAGVFNRALALFSPLGLVMRRLDELRVILCLYELVMLPLRLAFGTGYGYLAPPRCDPGPSMGCLQHIAWSKSCHVHLVHLLHTRDTACILESFTGQSMGRKAWGRVGVGGVDQVDTGQLSTALQLQVKSEHASTF